MKYISTIGKPTHFKPTIHNISACGIVNPDIFAYDHSEVNSVRCLRTKALQEAKRGTSRVKIHDPLFKLLKNATSCEIPKLEPHQLEFDHNCAILSVGKGDS
jgi:hypothetical protein